MNKNDTHGSEPFGPSAAVVVPVDDPIFSPT